MSGHFLEVSEQISNGHWEEGGVENSNLAGRIRDPF